MTFGVLCALTLAGLAGPLLAAGRPARIPVVVGELLAGLALGRSGTGWLKPNEPTAVFLGNVGFAMLMFSAGMHIPVRHAGLSSRIRRGALAAAAAALLAAACGWVVAHVTGDSHPWVLAVVLGGGSAAVVVPALEELGLLDADAVLVVAAQVAVADIAGIVAVPLVLRPDHAARAALGTALVALGGLGLVVLIRELRGRASVHRLRRQSKRNGWALDLRLSLVVLFALCWLATRSGTSILVAGFAVGLVVATAGGPKRLSRQVTGVAEGLFVPLFFVLLGARIDVRAFVHPGLVELALGLAMANVLLHIAVAALTRQPVGAGLVATAQLGVPAAITSLGLQERVLSPGEGAAILAAALASIPAALTGLAWLATGSASLRGFPWRLRTNTESPPAGASYGEDTRSQTAHSPVADQMNERS